MNKKYPFDIALIGWGMRGHWQLTMEHLAVLEKARDAFIFMGATPEIFNILKSMDLKIHDLRKIYKEGVPRKSVYAEVAEKVLNNGKRFGGAAFLFYGHPLIYCKPSRIIIRESKKLGLKLEIYPGISCLDQMFCDLRIDIRDRDIQVFHAQHLYEKKKNINPHVDLFLMQIGLLGQTKRGNYKPKLHLFERLKKHLEGFYPSNKKFFAIHLNKFGIGHDQIIKGDLKGLTKIAPLLDSGHTLFFKGIR